MKTNNANNRFLGIHQIDDSQTERQALPTLLRHWYQRLGYCSILMAASSLTMSHVERAMANETNRPRAKSVDDNDRSYGRPKKGWRKPELLRRQSEYRLPQHQGNVDLIQEFTGGDNCPGTPIPAGNYTAPAPFTDSGDTTGANNTVNRVYYFNYFYYNYGSEGPDHIYSFTLTGRGPNPRIEVSSTTYRPMIYILDGNRAGGCPAGTGQSAFNELVVSDSRWSSGSTAVLERGAMNFLPLNVPLFLFVDSRSNDSLGAGPYTVRMQDVTVAPVTSPPRTRFDFDGDGKADISVFRPSDRVWYRQNSSAGSVIASQFGLTTDRIVPGDYDGDGRADLAVYRPSEGIWYIQQSTSGFKAVRFGLSSDIPTADDFDGDGRTDIAVFRPETGVWWFLYSEDDRTGAFQFGLSGDVPVPGDYNGDGRSEIAVFRPSNGTWYSPQLIPGIGVYQPFGIPFGLSTDKPTQADYDGDGKTDIAVYRPSEGRWYLQRSTAGFGVVNFGIAEDIPAPADYDGDGKKDIAVFRPSSGIWYLLQSTGGFAAKPFGLTGDKPISAALSANN